MTNNQNGSGAIGVIVFFCLFVAICLSVAIVFVIHRRRKYKYAQKAIGDDRADSVHSSSPSPRPQTSIVPGENEEGTETVPSVGTGSNDDDEFEVLDDGNVTKGNSIDLNEDEFEICDDIVTPYGNQADEDDDILQTVNGFDRVRKGTFEVQSGDTPNITVR